MSLDIFRGETLGLVGESGCGKTTLGRTLLGLEQSCKGEMFFDGIALHRITAKEMKPLRKRLQVIFQDPLSSLNPRMTVLDIVTEGLGQFTKIKGEKEAHARRLLAEVGLSEGRGCTGSPMSFQEVSGSGLILPAPLPCARNLSFVMRPSAPLTCRSRPRC